MLRSHNIDHHISNTTHVYSIHIYDADSLDAKTDLNEFFLFSIKSIEILNSDITAEHKLDV